MTESEGGSDIVDVRCSIEWVGDPTMRSSQRVHHERARILAPTADGGAIEVAVGDIVELEVDAGAAVAMIDAMWDTVPGGIAMFRAAGFVRRDSLPEAPSPDAGAPLEDELVFTGSTEDRYVGSIRRRLALRDGPAAGDNWDAGDAGDADGSGVSLVCRYRYGAAGVLEPWSAADRRAALPDADAAGYASGEKSGGSSSDDGSAAAQDATTSEAEEGGASGATSADDTGEELDSDAPSHAAAEGEEDDEEKYNTNIRESIKVGSNHQASIPSLLEEPPSGAATGDDAVWCPQGGAGADVDDFLRDATRRVQDALLAKGVEKGEKTVLPSADVFLEVLHDCGYDAGAALRRIAEDPLRFVTVWAAGDVEKVDTALGRYGEDLQRARRLLEEDGMEVTHHALARYYFLFEATKSSSYAPGGGSILGRLQEKGDLRRSQRSTRRKRDRDAMKLTRRERAENFLRFAKGEMEPAKYKRVIEVLQDYDNGKVDPATLVRVLSEVCSPTSLVLYEFSHFVPRKFRCLLRLLPPGTAAAGAKDGGMGAAGAAAPGGTGGPGLVGPAEA